MASDRRIHSDILTRALHSYTQVAVTSESLPRFRFLHMRAPNHYTHSCTTSLHSNHGAHTYKIYRCMHMAAFTACNASHRCAHIIGRKAHIHTSIHVYVYTHTYIHIDTHSSNTINTPCHEMTKLASECFCFCFSAWTSPASRQCLAKEEVPDRKAGRASAPQRTLSLPSRSAKHVLFKVVGQTKRSLAWQRWLTRRALSTQASHQPSEQPQPTVDQLYSGIFLVPCQASLGLKLSATWQSSPRFGFKRCRCSD